MNTRSMLTLALIAGSALGSAALADPLVPWSNPTGTAMSFSWSGGGSDTGLFGSPTIVGDTFRFFPAAFRAQATSGGADIKYDRLEVTLEALPGFNFTEIRITERGDYGIVGAGGQVSVSGTMFLNDLVLPRTKTGDLATTPGSPITSGAGAWQGAAAVDVSGDVPKWTKLKLILNNNLIAIAGPSGVAFIEKKVGDLAVDIEILPAPGSLALLGLAGLATARRRR